MGYVAGDDGRGGEPPSYNVQMAVDADTGIVVRHSGA